MKYMNICENTHLYCVQCTYIYKYTYNRYTVIQILGYVNYRDDISHKVLLYNNTYIFSMICEKTAATQVFIYLYIYL